MKLVDIIDFNPLTPIKKGTTAPFIEMAALPTSARDIPLIDERVFSGSGSKFKDGDTLFARITPCLENGKGGFVSTLGAGITGHGSTEFIVMRAKAASDELFVYYVTRHQDFRAFAEQQMSGTSGRQRVAWQSLVTYELADLLPVDRTEIAATLGALDDKIELNRRMNETLEAMARALFRDWFVNFGPTRAKMAGEAPHLFPDLWSLFPDRLGDAGKPEGWEPGTLSDLATLNPESWTAKNSPQSIAYVDLANTKWGNIDKTEPYDWKDAPSRAKRILRPGDTIVGTVRPGNGSFTYIGEDGLTGSTGFAVLRPKNPRDRAFVWCAATSPENIDRLTHLADGGAYPAVRPEVVVSTDVVIPDANTLDAFCYTVAENLSLIEANKAESRTLAQTRDLLLPRLMSGELRVAQAERIAEGVL